MADPHIRSDYLHPVFDPAKLDRIVRRMRKALPAYNPDTIVCRGVSGMSLAFILSVRSGIPVTIVRKPGEGSHSVFNVEGVERAYKYIIVDDFIEHGNTLSAIAVGVGAAWPCVSKCAAVFTHRGDPHRRTRAKIDEIFGKDTDWRDFNGA